MTSRTLNCCDALLCCVFVILCCILSLSGYSHATHQKREIITDKEQEYLMKFGYLSSNLEGAGALRTEESVRQALRDLQRFAHIPVTGELDERTIELMSAPRCGVKDFERPASFGGGGGASRRKRYVLHSGHPWQHTNLTWSLRTKNASGINLHEAERIFSRALDVWAQNSRLTFTRVNDDRADILIYFHRGEHGDLFPFDGKGQILAHAFFPGPGKGGDAHFDMDEVWITNDRDLDEAGGTNLFKVAAHEFGHSLGLAHSHEDGALMAPWYQGSSKSTDYQLPADDRQAIQALYGRKPDYRYYTTPTTTTTTTRPPYPHNPYYPSNPRHPYYPNHHPYNTPHYPRYTTTQKPRKPMHPWKKHPYPKDPYKYPGGYTTKAPYAPRERPPERFPTRRPYYPTPPTQTTTTTTTTRRPPIRHYPDNAPKKPDSCNTSFDAVAIIRREVFFFKDAYFWRIGEKGLLPGHPALITRMWSALPQDLTHVDAVYETPDNKIVFFIDRRYYVFTANDLDSGYPKPLTSLGLPASLDKVDGATVWGHNGKTFFFSGHQYWRFDEDSKMVELDYPREMNMWKGVGDNVDAVFQWRDGKTYFFKDKGFWKFDDIRMQVERPEQTLSGPFWFGCSHNFEESHTRKQPYVADEPFSSTDTVRSSYIFIFLALVLLYYHGR